MTFLAALTAIGVAIATGLTFALKYLARTWKLGPFLDQEQPEVPPTMPPEAPKSPPVAPIVPEVVEEPKIDKLRLFCLAHQKFESYAPGTTSFKLSNPGNLKNRDGSWQTFPTYEAGFAALEDYVRRVATGKHPAYPKGGNTSIKEYVSIYAPDGPVIIANYAKALSTAVGTTPDQKMSWLLI